MHVSGVCVCDRAQYPQWKQSKNIFSYNKLFVPWNSLSLNQNKKFNLKLYIQKFGVSGKSENLTQLNLISKVKISKKLGD